MRIERLILKEVGPFDDLDITFPAGNDPERADIYLFVGPNGSGKSSLLYTLARSMTPQQTDFLARLRGTDSGALVRFSNGHFVLCDSYGNTNETLLESMSDEQAEHVRKNQTFESSNYIHWPDGGDGVLDKLSRASESFPNDFKTDYAGFAYSTKRTVNTGRVQQIAEHRFNPLEDALTFTATENESNDFVQWLANTITKKALALMRGATEEADRRQASLSRLQHTLTTITGLSVQFSMAETPLSVQLRLAETWLELDVLPEGLKSILSWLGDLLMRLENIQWSTNVALTDRSFTLLLDEIEVHLHPVWQRRLLPTLQTLFPNAQIFLATHSPFVVASANDAYIYPITLDEHGKAHVTNDDVLPSRLGHSYPAILSEVFGLDSEFDLETEEKLEHFRDLRARKLKGEAVDDALNALVKELSDRSVELRDIMARELRSLARLEKG